MHTRHECKFAKLLKAHHTVNHDGSTDLGLRAGVFFWGCPFFRCLFRVWLLEATPASRLRFFIYSQIKEFGALVFAATMNVRQVVSILVSYAPDPFLDALMCYASAVHTMH